MLSLQLNAQTVNFVTCNDEQKALGLCQQLVKDLDNENALLKQKIGTLVEQRDEAEKALEKATQPAFIPAWGWVVIGAVLGVGTYAAIRH
jgi:hypothetical protein